MSRPRFQEAPSTDALKEKPVYLGYFLVNVAFSLLVFGAWNAHFRSVSIGSGRFGSGTRTVSGGRVQKTHVFLITATAFALLHPSCLK